MNSYKIGEIVSLNTKNSGCSLWRRFHGLQGKIHSKSNGAVIVRIRDYDNEVHFLHINKKLLKVEREKTVTETVD
jgi:ribosomal protein L21E